MKPESVRSIRLHYLDWLRVLATLGVFIFHSVRPFDHLGWSINNSEKSIFATIFIVFLYPWGMPLFFMMSGAGTFFALKRRSYRQYVVERVQRLLIPYVVGSILLTPVQGYFEAIHKNLWSGTFIEFLSSGVVLKLFAVRFIDVGWGPRVFGAWGYHLWFLGFLFLYSLMAIPVFGWLRSEKGSRFTEVMVKLVSKRMGVIIFVIPLALIQIGLNPIFPAQNDWADFFFQFLFFIYGYILFSDERIRETLKKDLVIGLILSIASSVLVLSTIASEFTDSISTSERFIDILIRWGVFSINSWFWIVSMIIIGMRYLDQDTKLLKYCKVAILPFYLVHHPVIIALSFYVVQWNTSTVIKILCVMGGSFLITLGIFELIIKRIKPIRNFLT